MTFELQEFFQNNNLQEASKITRCVYVDSHAPSLSNLFANLLNNWSIQAIEKASNLQNKTTNQVV